MPRGKHGGHVSGKDHPRWSGDRKIISSHGYVKVRVGGHPLADPNGYAYEHLLVWVSAGKPHPPPGWVLHHRNGNRKDNRIENLQMIHRGAHNAVHNRDRRHDARGRFLPKKAAGRELDGRAWDEAPEFDISPGA